MLHDRVLPDRHEANHDCSASWWGLEAYIKQFCEFKRGVKSSWGCCRLEVLLYSEITTPIHRRDGDDTIMIFGAARVWTVQKWSHNMTNTRTREFLADLQIQNCLSLKYRWFVSLHSAFRYVGADVI